MAEKSIPRVKTLSNKVEYPVSKCGDNWWIDVRIRCPYKGTDTAYRTLPSLGSRSQVEKFDRTIVEEIIMDLSRVTLFADAHAADISDRQMRNIKSMLDRAHRYSVDADSIWTTWSSGFSTESGQTVPPSPLGSRRASGSAALGLAKDEGKWKALVTAALRNLRCAEEVAKRATIRSRNVTRHSQARVFAGVGNIAPSPTKSVGKIASGVRKDRLGHKAWRIWYDGNYRAQIMISSSQWAGVQEEVGSASTANGARALLRDRFNSELLSKHPNESPKNDPHDIFSLGSVPDIQNTELIAGLSLAESDSDELESELSMGEIDLEDLEDPPTVPTAPTAPPTTPTSEPKTKAPKRDNLLIVGAAAIGLLVFAKRG